MTFRHIHLLIYFKEPVEALYMIWTWASAMFWGSKSWCHFQVCGIIYKQKTTHKDIFLSLSPPLLRHFFHITTCLRLRCEDFWHEIDARHEELISFMWRCHALKQFDEMYGLLLCHSWEHMFKIYLQIFQCSFKQEKKSKVKHDCYLPVESSVLAKSRKKHCIKLIF